MLESVPTSAVNDDKGCNINNGIFFFSSIITENHNVEIFFITGDKGLMSKNHIHTQILSTANYEYTYTHYIIIIIILHCVYCTCKYNVLVHVCAIFIYYIVMYKDVYTENPHIHALLILYYNTHKSG